MGGAFGYELDLTKLTAEEKDLIRRQVKDYKRFAPLVTRGDLCRLILPSDTVNGRTGCCAAWEYVSPDRTEALVTFVVIRTTVHPVYFLRLEGLDPGALYEDESSGARYRGDTLMRAGLNLTKNWKDGESVTIFLTKVPDAEK